MKSVKYLAVAMVAVLLVSCGDDEPKNNYTREFTMIYPQFEAGHKSISKIEKSFDNGALTVATVDYDGDYVKHINVISHDKAGALLNEEDIYIDYKNGAIICDKSIQDKTYAFEVNGQGAITKLSDVSTGRTASVLRYNGANRLEEAQTVTPSSTATTKMKWENGNLLQWVESAVAKLDSVDYVYGTSALPNKGGIDLVNNQAFTFVTMVCSVLRNAGLFGATSANLPIAFKHGLDYSSGGGTDVEQKYYAITYEFDAQGYVKSYTTTETPKFTVKFTYR